MKHRQKQKKIEEEVSGEIVDLSVWSPRITGHQAYQEGFFDYKRYCIKKTLDLDP